MKRIHVTYVIKEQTVTGEYCIYEGDKIIEASYNKVGLEDLNRLRDMYDLPNKLLKLTI